MASSNFLDDSSKSAFTCEREIRGYGAIKGSRSEQSWIISDYIFLILSFSLDSSNLDNDYPGMPAAGAKSSKEASLAYSKIS